MRRALLTLALVALAAVAALLVGLLYDRLTWGEAAGVAIVGGMVAGAIIELRRGWLGE